MLNDTGPNPCADGGRGLMTGVFAAGSTELGPRAAAVCPVWLRGGTGKNVPTQELLSSAPVGLAVMLRARTGAPVTGTVRAGCATVLPGAPSSARAALVFAADGAPQPARRGAGCGGDRGGINDERNNNTGERGEMGASKPPAGSCGCGCTGGCGKAAARPAASALAPQPGVLVVARATANGLGRAVSGPSATAAAAPLRVPSAKLAAGARGLVRRPRLGLALALAAPATEALELGLRLA